jgi:hypothetical protein
MKIKKEIIKKKNQKEMKDGKIDNITRKNKINIEKNKETPSFNILLLKNT